MKYEYSPGLKGYGVKGNDGSSGLSGLSLYFTDLEHPRDYLDIKTRIKNNWALFLNSPPGTTLPNNRTYQNGDLFITSYGYVFKITDASNGIYVQTDGLLTKENYFEKSNPLISALYGFNERWLNKNSINSTHYLIDNNFSSVSNYLYPSNIYGVDLKNFTRIEYTDSSAFSLYSSAKYSTIDDSKVLGIIFRDNAFRIGNLDDNDNVRNTNLIFDVSLLKIERNTCFGVDASIGEILTNNEIGPLSLCSDYFNYSPASNAFGISKSGTDCSIYWNLSAFTSDPDVTATIIFSASPLNYNNSIVFDASVYKQMMFHNIDSSGSIKITNLNTNYIYIYKIVIEKNGWERFSSTKSITV